LRRLHSYDAVLEPAEEGRFLASGPARPEICTEVEAEAKALAMAMDAIELVFANRTERSEPILAHENW
jgi:predicted RNase H-like HicB family nuclease